MRRVNDVKNVREFLAKYYRGDRYTGRGPAYAAVLLASHNADYERDGYDLISHHDSNTGEVLYFGKTQTWMHPERDAIVTVPAEGQMTLF